MILKMAPDWDVFKENVIEKTGGKSIQKFINL